MALESASGSREEKFLETFFPLISQFAFDKAKDLTEKEKETVKPAGAVFGSSSSVFGSSSSLFGSTWGLLVHCLAQFVTAEKAYMSLSFLEQKGFFHRSKDLKSLYQNLITEIKKVEDSSDQSRQGEFEQLLAHLSGHLCHYLTAKLKTMEFYEQISAMGTMKVINYSDLVIVITDIVQSCSKSFHHPLLSPLKATFGLECDAILHLLQAQILMSDWKFLASLMQLYEAHTKLTTWGATAQLKETKKSTFGSSSKHSGWPALYIWLTKYKGFLLSKFSLYFYDVLQKHTTNNEMKGLITKATEDFVARLMTFQRRSDAHYVSLVLDVQSLGSSYISPGYNHPEKNHTTPQGLDSFPSIFSYPQSERPAQHWPNVVSLISNRPQDSKMICVHDKKAQSTYFLSQVDTKVTLVVIFESKKSEKDSYVNNFIVEFSSSLKGTKLFNHFKPGIKG